MSVWDMGRSPSSLPQQTTEFDENLRKRLNGEQTFNDASPRFEDWSPDKQRAAYEGMRRSDENLTITRENADTFLATHPEFVDTDANGDALNRTLKAMFGDCVHTLEQFEKAYEVARANNVLELDKSAIAKQEAAASKQRANAERARIVNRTEQELETMPLEEIRRLATIERQKQMRKIAEEGGW